MAASNEGCCFTGVVGVGLHAGCMATSKAKNKVLANPQDTGHLAMIIIAGAAAFGVAVDPATANYIVMAVMAVQTWLGQSGRMQKIRDLVS